MQTDYYIKTGDTPETVEVVHVYEEASEQLITVDEDPEKIAGKEGKSDVEKKTNVRTQMMSTAMIVYSAISSDRVGCRWKKPKNELQSASHSVNGFFGFFVPGQVLPREKGFLGADDEQEFSAAQKKRDWLKEEKEDKTKKTDNEIKSLKLLPRKEPETITSEDVGSIEELVFFEQEPIIEKADGDM